MRWALLLLVLTSGIQSFSMPVADNDLWGHVRFGEAILADGVEVQNLYSYTAPDHPWINHEIIAECTFAWVHDSFGPTGLLVLKLAMGLLTLTLMGLGTVRRTPEPLAAAVALIVSAAMMSWGYLIRPQLFTFLFLALEWELLQRDGAKQTRAIWWIPVIIAVWNNSHGGVLAGIAILFVVASLRGWESPSERKRLAALTGLAAAALLINPYGMRLLVFLAEDVARTRAITEWAAIPLLDGSNLRFKAVVALVCVMIAVRGRTPRWEIAAILLAAIAAFQHERHLPLFGILVAPLLGEMIGAILTNLRRRAGLERISLPMQGAIALGCVVIAVIQLRASAAIHQSLGYGIFVSPILFPVSAVRFLNENRLEGNLAVPFDWGEYAIWHLHPGSRVSIDGRYTTAYPDAVIEAAWRYQDGEAGWDRLLEEADLALADARHATLARLEASREWRRIYDDPTASIFARRGFSLPGTLRSPSPLADPQVALFP